MNGCCIRRPVVLVLARYYLPGFKAGGPIRSISNVVAALHGSCDFRIMTTDRDHAEPSPFENIAINDWNEFAGAKVFYADAAHRRSASLRRIISAVDPDVVYLNSFFSPTFGALPLGWRKFFGTGSRARWIVAPRGEFSPGAMALKAWKKRPFIRAARLAGLFDGITWQATSEPEMEDIRRETGDPDAAIVLASNITEGVGDFVEPAISESPARPLKVCFVSRVSRKKNLAFAVEAMARARSPVEQIGRAHV